MKPVFSWISVLHTMLHGSSAICILSNFTSLFFNVCCSLLHTPSIYCSSSSFPWVCLALQLSERWCQHTSLLTSPWGFAYLAEEQLEFAGIAWMSITLQPFYWGFSVLSSMSSSQCLVFTMLVESHYVLKLCTFGWNWFSVKKQSHRKQNTMCNFNFPCTMMISSSSDVCLHAAGTGKDGLWAGLVCITGVPLCRCAQDL